MQIVVDRNGVEPRIESESVNESEQSSQRTVIVDMERAMAKRMDLERAPLTRNETRRSKSKVRSYLRRCKEVITGHHHNQANIGGKMPMADVCGGDDGPLPSATRIISLPHEPVSQRPTDWGTSSSPEPFDGNRSESVAIEMVTQILPPGADQPLPPEAPLPGQSLEIGAEVSRYILSCLY